MVSWTGLAETMVVHMNAEFTRETQAETTSAGKQARHGREHRLDTVQDKFYAISVERRITHPAVKLIADRAKRRLFA
jgi:hypothetical protein